MSTYDVSPLTISSPVYFEATENCFSASLLYFVGFEAIGEALGIVHQKLNPASKTFFDNIFKLFQSESLAGISG